MQYSVGDVVLVSNIVGISEPTIMTVAAIKLGVLTCIWFDKEHHLHKRAFWVGSSKVRPFNLTISVPPSVIVDIRRYNGIQF